MSAGGSGKGNSFDSDYLKCPRYFYWQHRQGVRRREQGDGAALVVGTAGHAWMERFHELETGDVETAVASADDAFEGAIADACAEARGFGFDLITLDQRATTAVNLLHALAPQFAARVARGERTLACEMHGTLALPAAFGGRLIRGDLTPFTVALDRVFYHPGDEEMPLAGIALDEYKFTSMASPKMYAENMLLNDQSLGYLYWLDRLLQAEDPPSGPLEDHWRTQKLLGVRYRVFRVDGKIGPASYAEVWEPVDRAKLADWYTRKLHTRADLSAQWDRPMDEWRADRYAFGPCHSFGRECTYAGLCGEPGAEAEKIGEMEDAGTEYVRVGGEELERLKP